MNLCSKEFNLLRFPFYSIRFFVNSTKILESQQNLRHDSTEPLHTFPIIMLVSLLKIEHVLPRCNISKCFERRPKHLDDFDNTRKYDQTISFSSFKNIMQKTYCFWSKVGFKIGAMMRFFANREIRDTCLRGDQISHYTKYGG